MICGISGWQDSGKTLIMRMLADEVILDSHTKKVVHNMTLFDVTIPEKYFVSTELVKYITGMIPRQERNTMVLIDEADRVFPARFWNDKAQTMALIGCWQDEKMNNDFLYTFHKGRGCDKVLRDATSVEIDVLGIDRVNWSIQIEVRNWLYGVRWQTMVRYVDLYFRKYDRWQVVV